MLPTVVFVLGKGGVGRTTVAAALGGGLASRGRRVLVAQWTVSDALSPWYGSGPVGHRGHRVAPGLDTMNFSVEDALAQYFEDHLGMRTLYRAVIARGSIRRATRAAPGLEELMFLGTLMWNVTLAREDRGWVYDHVIVDTPALGHGEALLDLPRVTRTLGLGGMLARECQRISDLLSDPARAGAVLVSTLEELAAEESREFWPRAAEALGRPPLVGVINRSVAALGELPASHPEWMAALEAGAPASVAAGLGSTYVQLAQRAERERELADFFQGAAPLGVARVEEALLEEENPGPLAVVRRATADLREVWDA